MESSLITLVWQRASRRCEYYQIPQDFDDARFEIDLMPRIAKRLVIFSLFIALSIYLFIFMHNVFSPTDWVDVTVLNVPDNTQQIYLIADVSGDIQVLNAYHSKVFPFSDDPRVGGSPWYWNQPKIRRFGSVQWPWANRFGAVAQRKDKSWILWWFRSEDIVGPPTSRWMWGGTWAEITLPEESRSVPLSNELLERLALPDKSDS